MRSEDMLPEGVDHVERGGITVRKGSVGAFLHSAGVLANAGVDEAERAAAARDVRELVPALTAIGLFDVFEIRDPALRALVEEARAPQPPRQ